MSVRLKFFAPTFSEDLQSLSSESYKRLYNMKGLNNNFFYSLTNISYFLLSTLATCQTRPCLSEPTMKCRN